MKLIRILSFVAALSACSQAPSQLKIVNGKEATVSSQVSKHTVALVNSDSMHTFCTGSLIAPRWVLSAAHCFQRQTSDITHVAFGLGFLSEKKQSMIAGKVYAHSGFRRIANAQIHLNNHDIALIHLEKAAPSFMSPVKLGSEDQFGIGQEVILAGYGRTSMQKNSDKILRYTTTNIEQITDDNVIIYRSENEINSACLGDSGGPMFIMEAGELLQIGVTEGPYLQSSLSRTACMQQGSYHNVSRYQDWLTSTMKSAEKMKN